MALSGFKKFYGKEGEYVSPAELFDYVREHPMPDGRMIPILIWGSKGTGKTQQIKAYCKERGLDMRSYHPAHDVDGQDILGKPYTDEDTGTVRFSLPEWLPKESGNGGVWFIDEINRAQQAVLAGLMEPLGEGTISQSGWKIPEGWMIIAAANPTETGYMVEDIDEAMVDRMLHYTPGWEAPVWGNWASTEGGIDPDIINFTFQRADLIPATSSYGQSQLPHEIEDKLGATPRSLTYFAALYDRNMSEGMLRVVSQGLLGMEASKGFVETLQQESRPLTGEEILAAPVESAGSKKYMYDDRLELWKSSPAEYENHIQASVQHLVVELLRLGEYSPPAAEPGKDYHNDIEENKVAQRAGRFMAKLQSRSREEGLRVIARSAPKWSSVIQESSKRWYAVINKGGSVTPELITGMPGLPHG